MIAPRSYLAVAFLSVLFITTPALAQGTNNNHGPPPAVRQLAEEGIKQFKAGKYEEAAAIFGQAQSQYKAPQYLLYIGRSYEKLGKLIEASEQLAAAAGMKAPPDAPKDFAQKFEKATALAAESTDHPSATSVSPPRIAASGSCRKKTRFVCR
jgi:tetratricopeptide (TPR) repeat protein